LTARHNPILSEFASDPDMSELISRFVMDLPARIGSIVSDWRAQDYSGVERSAHDLRCASTGHGFPVIGLAASRVITDLRGRSAEQIASEADRITGDLQRLADLCACARSSRP